MLDLYSYISWLERFTKYHSYFKNHEWWNNDYTQEEKNNVRDIKEFFEIISKYATRHSISPMKDDCGYYFIINHNNVYYRIGVEIKMNSYWYCFRYENVIGDTSIDFDNIATDNLNILEETVKELINSNVSIKKIEETFNNAITKYKKK